MQACQIVKSAFLCRNTGFQVWNLSGIVATVLQIASKISLFHFLLYGNYSAAQASHMGSQSQRLFYTLSANQASGKL